MALATNRSGQPTLGNALGIRLAMYPLTAWLIWKYILRERLIRLRIRLRVRNMCQLLSSAFKQIEGLCAGEPSFEIFDFEYAELGNGDTVGTVWTRHFLAKGSAHAYMGGILIPSKSTGKATLAADVYLDEHVLTEKLRQRNIYVILHMRDAEDWAQNFMNDKQDRDEQARRHLSSLL